MQKSIAALMGFIVLSTAFSSFADDTQAPNPAITRSISLATQSGFTIGGQVSAYHYGEDYRHSFLMEEYGPSFGITGSAIKTFQNSGFYVGLDGRFAYGNNQYNGSGTLNGAEDLLGDIRLLGGKDFVFDHNGSGLNWSISPYVGLGYRNLFNDLRGTSSTGALGYRRDSQYLYLPVGETTRFRLTDTSRISANLEYDQLLQGWQTTYTGDYLAGASNVDNDQNGGYGLRGSVMYEWSAWSVGPFAEYWNINQSSPACNNVACGWIEPHNQTIEAGLQARYHF